MIIGKKEIEHLDDVDYQKGTVISRRSRFLEELSHEDYEEWQVGTEGDIKKDSYSSDYGYEDDDIIEL